jgi:4-diphosphocytidyl-2-C-methyl-D-erythritol kinase
MPLVVTELARAKVNLTLRLTGRRSDGYHLLDSIIAFADVGDRLNFEEARRFELTVTGPFAPHMPKGEDNLVARAARAFSTACGGPPHSMRIALEKNLPVASGLGGGSADAAATLRGLAKLFAFDAGEAALDEIAATLGADVPVCLTSRASHVRGIGEIVEPITDFAPRHAVLVNPGVAVGTADVFRELNFTGEAQGRDPCRNDLTAAAIKLAPVIGDVLDELKRRPGVELARMSGSGATCFGLFPSPDMATEAAKEIAANHPGWWCRATILS